MLPGLLCSQQLVPTAGGHCVEGELAFDKQGVVAVVSVNYIAAVAAAAVAAVAAAAVAAAAAAVVDVGSDFEAALDVGTPVVAKLG